MIFAYQQKFSFLRNGIKIKSFILLISWLLIFAHEIIPHNHFDSGSCHPTGLIHTERHHDVSGHDSFRKLCEDYSSCGISGLIFQKFSNDEYFILTNCKTYSFFAIPPTRIEVHFTQNNFTEDPSGTIPLRGPPVS